MEYNDSKPIFRQVADYCLGCIGSGQWEPTRRIPSTKELALRLEVNNRTIIKAYEELETAGLIYQLRGQGFFCAPDAPERLLAMQRLEFRTSTAPEFLAGMHRCGITLNEAITLLQELDKSH